jgi:hypothetical protein
MPGQIVDTRCAHMKKLLAFCAKEFERGRGTYAIWLGN